MEKGFADPCSTTFKNRIMNALLVGQSALISDPAGRAEVTLTLTILVTINQAMQIYLIIELLKIVSV